MHRLSSTSSRSLRRAAAKAAKPTLVRGAHKEIKFSNEGRASILKGVDILANAVQVTLGPKGTYVHLCILIGADCFQVAMSSLNSRLVVQKSPRVCTRWTLAFRFLTLFLIDGVTVAKAITLKDKFENLGAR